jgi:lipid-A-disaccharide synthase-like uncharacterized protein
MSLSNETLWLMIGFTGQVFFSARFLIQWLHSERHKRSLIPSAFWYFSVLGSLTLLTYAIYRQDPVFIVGQSAGLLIYTRNLQLLAQERRRNKAGHLEQNQI